MYDLLSNQYDNRNEIVDVHVLFEAVRKARDAFEQFPTGSLRKEDVVAIDAAIVVLWAFAEEMVNWTPKGLDLEPKTFLEATVDFSARQRAFKAEQAAERQRKTQMTYIIYYAPGNGGEEVVEAVFTSIEQMSDFLWQPENVALARNLCRFPSDLRPRQYYPLAFEAASRSGGVAISDADWRVVQRTKKV